MDEGTKLLLQLLGLLIAFVGAYILMNKLFPKRKRTAEEEAEYRREMARLEAREKMNERIAKQEGRWNLGSYGRHY